MRKVGCCSIPTAPTLSISRDDVFGENRKDKKKILAATYFPGYVPVSSALEGLTSEFGMGSGVTPPLKPPRI